MTVMFNGPGPLLPNPQPINVAPALATGMVIAATGDKLCYLGRVDFQGSTGSKSIRKVHFNFGAVTKAGGSGLTLSLQDVSLTAGPVARPDEVQDQTYAIANADAAFAANTWYTTGNLSADRSVAFGELLAVVIEYDAGGRLGADTVTINGVATTSSSSSYTCQNQGLCVTKIGGTWANVAQSINVILEFSDGSFGTLGWAWPLTTFSAVTYNSGSAADEYCLEFQLPFAAAVDGMWALVAESAGGNFNMVLYDGTTAMQTVFVDQNATLSGSARYIFVPFPVTSLAANTIYRISVLPTTTTNVSLHYFDVAAAGHFAAHAFGTTGVINSRVDGGAWGTATATRRPWMGIRLAGIEPLNMARVMVGY